MSIANFSEQFANRTPGYLQRPAAAAIFFENARKLKGDQDDRILPPVTARGNVIFRRDISKNSNRFEEAESFNPNKPVA